MPRMRTIDGEVVGRRPLGGYAAYSAAPTEPVVVEAADVTALADTMDSAISALRTAVLRARAAVVVTPTIAEGAAASAWLMPILGPLGLPIATWLGANATSADVQASVSAGLDVMDNLIQTRLVNEKPNVLAGRLTPDKWFASAGEIKVGIARILEGLNEGTLSSQLQLTVNDLQSQFYVLWDKLKKAGAALPAVGLGLGFVGAVLAGLAAWFILVPVAREYLRAPLRLAPGHTSGFMNKRRRVKRSRR